jgi:hypothetical protein
VYELDIDAITEGRRRYRAHLTKYAECLESGVWDGYGAGCDLVSLPPWSFKPEQE